MVSALPLLRALRRETDAGTQRQNIKGKNRRSPTPRRLPARQDILFKTAAEKKQSLFPIARSFPRAAYVRRAKSGLKH